MDVLMLVRGQERQDQVTYIGKGREISKVKPPAQDEATAKNKVGEEWTDFPTGVPADPVADRSQFQDLAVRTGGMTSSQASPLPAGR